MKVLFFCNYKFPLYCANAARVMVLCKLFKALGYEPVILGVDYFNDAQTSGDFNGVKYYNLSSGEKHHKLDYFRRKRQYNKYLKKWMSEYLAKNKVKYILSSHGYDKFANSLIGISKTTGIEIIENVVEWYDKDDFQGVTKYYDFICNRYALMCLFKKEQNILAISTYLDEYYKKANCKTLRIPSIVDIDEYAALKPVEESEKIIFAYAGYPGTKDSILNFIRAISELSDDVKKRIEFRIYGCTSESLLELGLEKTVYSKIVNTVVCFGLLEQKKIKYEIAKADFTVLVRSVRKSNTAGFPTKLAESLACGVPVIANLTSDLNMYIKDGVNSIICKNDSIEECLKAINRTLTLSREQIQKLHKNSFETAKENFDYRNYISELKFYLEKIDEKRKNESI